MAKSTYKPRPPATLGSATEALINACGGPSAAADLPGCRVGRKQLFNYTDDEEDNADKWMPADIVRALERHAGDPILTRFLAAESGHALIPLMLDVDIMALPPQVARAAKEAAEVFGAMAIDLADGTVTAREAGRTIEEIDDALKAFGALRGELMAIRDGGVAAVREPRAGESKSDPRVREDDGVVSLAGSRTEG
jgi:hypothetical protein